MRHREYILRPGRRVLARSLDFCFFMEMKNFTILDHSDQILVIKERAVLLTHRFSGNYSITLFQLDGFYIELFYHLVKQDYKKIRIFEDLIFLDPYLDSIDITDLCDCRN
jgi:hypothetical protein